MAKGAYRKHRALVRKINREQQIKNLRNRDKNAARARKNTAKVFRGIGDFVTDLANSRLAQFVGLAAGQRLAAPTPYRPVNGGFGGQPPASKFELNARY